MLLLIPGITALLVSLWLFPFAFSTLTLTSLRNGFLFLPLSLTLFSLLSVLVGMCSFWLIKTDSIFALLMLTLEFFGGRLLPLDLLPPWLERISRFLPLRFGIAGPVEAILHPASTPLLPLFLGQMLWCLFLFGVVLLLWKPGMRRYDSVGG